MAAATNESTAVPEDGCTLYSACKKPMFWMCRRLFSPIWTTVGPSSLSAKAIGSRPRTIDQRQRLRLCRRTPDRQQPHANRFRLGKSDPPISTIRVHNAFQYLKGDMIRKGGHAHSHVPLAGLLNRTAHEREAAELVEALPPGRCPALLPFCSWTLDRFS